jgi:hypothetical protein
MSFNYPMFLWALSALTIPIIIHLFNFRRTTRIYFSNINFLKQVKQETTQKRKLKQYLILASRLLFLFFLVMVFAQPFIPAKEQLSTQRNISVYLDNSFSMSAPIEDKVRALDAGVSFVREIVNLFPPETRFKLITNDFAPYSNSFKTGSEISDLISQVRLSPVSRSFLDVYNRIDKSVNALFWISDFQKSTFGEGLFPDSLIQLRLVPIEYEKLSNVFVDSVYLENPFVIGGEKNSLKLRLRNEGVRTIDGLNTKLTINGIQAATTSVVLQPNSTAETVFDLSGTMKGFNEAVISFNDFPVSFDNEFYFTLNYSDRLRIVEIKPDSKITYVEKVFGNKQLFDFKSFSVSNLDYGLLDQADLVVINNLNRLDNALTAALQSYQNKGGYSLLISSSHPDVDSYRKLINLPFTKLDNSLLQVLDKPDFQNPFFENVFEDKNQSITMPQAKQILNWGVDRSAILKFKNGNPFLSRYNNNFLMASPLEDGITDFYNNALFVPVMYRIAASGKRIERKLYHFLSSSLIEIKTDSLYGEEPAKLVGPQELVPVQRRLADRLLIEIPRFTVNHGFYRVMHKNDTLDLLAFNIDKSESTMDQFSGEEVKTALGGGNNVSIFKASSTETFSNEIKERYLGTPLWKYALVLALIFLLAEILLIRFLK